MNGPVVDLGSLHRTDSSLKKLLRFEADAFGRSTTDSDFQRKRLDPIHKNTRLKEVSWPTPSATAYRHKVDLRHRYAGAMKSHSSFPLSTDSDPWTNRTAILADLSSVELTRPQVRAILPLTRRLDQEPSPPLSCLLAERPFDQAGLADRIAAEIETIEKFGFFDIESPSEESEDNIVAVKELRKEVGPDPRLKYIGVEPDASRRYALKAEGPIGLHFDAPETRSPAFSNAQYLLHLVDGREQTKTLEENFVGVTLRRYMDPDWCWQAPVDKKDRLPDVWWCDVPMLTEGNHIVLRSGDLDAITISPEGPDIKVAVSQLAIYPQPVIPDQVPATLELCRTRDSHRVGMLTHKLDTNRYSTSIFIVAEKATEPARLLSSIDWTGNPGLVLLSIKDGAETELSPIPTKASNATFVEWARTGRDFQKFALHSLDEPEREVAQVSVNDIKISSNSGGNLLNLNTVAKPGESIRLTSTTGLEPYPLHIQRHLAAIVMKPSAALGREIAQFDRMILFDGSTITLAGTGDPVADGATVRIVEYETRSEILTNIAAAPEHYKAAYFDRVSIGANRPMNGFDELRFHLRITNRALSGIGSLMLTLQSNDLADTRIVELEMSLPNDEEVSAVDLLLNFDSDNNKINWAYSFRTLNGRSEEFAGGAVDALFLTDEGSMSEGILAKLLMSDAFECWADVSMLHSRKKKQQASSAHFDFDWVFTSEALIDDPRIATRTENIRDMLEAQVRIIGVSDAINVRS